MTTQTDLLIPGLHASAPTALSFAPDTHVRAFRLERSDDDLLVYAAPGAGADGATRQYLGHWHEAMVGDAAPGAQVIVHAGDAEETAAHGFHVRAAFDRAFHLGDDFEAIPIPGHTPGSTAYLWDTGEHHVLFTSDSLYHGPDGTWRAAMLGSSDRAAYVASLDRLAGLSFDVLAPWAAPAAGPAVVVIDPEHARAQILAARDRIRAGEDG